MATIEVNYTNKITKALIDSSRVDQTLSQKLKFHKTKLEGMQQDLKRADYFQPVIQLQKKVPFSYRYQPFQDYQQDEDVNSLERSLKYITSDPSLV